MVKPGRDNMKNAKTGDSKLLIAAFAGLHLLCCGIPLLLLSGVSLAFLMPSWPVMGGLFAVVGVIGFIWYLKRGCATCPRNEGRCSPGLACATEENTIDNEGKPPR
jgi:hypothetical protein